MLVPRRTFLGTAIAAIGATVSPRFFWPRVQQHGPQRIALDAGTLTPFVDALPLPAVASPVSPGHYRIAMSEIAVRVHRDLPPTRMWGFGGSVPGPTIVTRSGSAVTVDWVNQLPARHFLPVDHTLHGAEPDKPEVRAVVHLHGGRTPHDSDGYPDDWYVSGQSRTHTYPNRQDAALLFYHDHAQGITRLNVYAGLFGGWLIRDAEEDALGLPAGEREILLVMCDRMFDRQGQLYYPEGDDPAAPWVPEFFGNALMINGKLWPKLEVAARRYRFRILNGSNGRFLTLSLSNRQPLTQIGSDQGLFGAPVALPQMILAPAERADVVVDFNGATGQTLTLRNDVVDVMQIKVRAGTEPTERPLPARLRELQRISEHTAVQTRALTLTEYFDRAGRTTLLLLDGKYWHDPVSETPRLNSTEIWTFINTTDDSHPLHLHLVRFQILDRRNYDVDQFLRNGTVRFTDPPVAPDANEMGWKDIVKAHGGMVTRIIVKFEGYAGRYLWHCHILEHEAKDMMRPFEVLPAEG